jgi:AraC-like DNA-binding protein
MVFGLCSAPLVLRTPTASFSIRANTPWAVRSSIEWRLAVSDTADLRLVHSQLSDIDLVDAATDLQRPTRFDGAASQVVRAAIRATTPVWVDDADRPIANLAEAGQHEHWRLAGSRQIAGDYDQDAVSAFVQMMTWALDQQDVLADPRLNSVIRYVSAHLHDPALSTATIASHVRLSRRTLQALFTGHGGIAAYVRRQRVTSAVRMLTEAPGTVPDLERIAVATGLGSRRTLQRAMRHVYGVTPLQARAQVLAGFQLRERAVSSELAVPGAGRARRSGPGQLVRSATTSAKASSAVLTGPSGSTSSSFLPSAASPAT